MYGFQPSVVVFIDLRNAVLIGFLAEKCPAAERPAVACQASRAALVRATPSLASLWMRRRLGRQQGQFAGRGVEAMAGQVESATRPAAQAAQAQCRDLRIGLVKDVEHGTEEFSMGAMLTPRP